MNTNNNNENDSQMEMIEFLQNNDLICCQNVFIKRNVRIAELMEIKDLKEYGKAIGLDELQRNRLVKAINIKKKQNYCDFKEQIKIVYVLITKEENDMYERLKNIKQILMDKETEVLRKNVDEYKENHIKNVDEINGIFEDIQNELNIIKESILKNVKDMESKHNEKMKIYCGNIRNYIEKLTKMEIKYNENLNIDLNVRKDRNIVMIKDGIKDYKDLLTNHENPTYQDIKQDIIQLRKTLSNMCRNIGINDSDSDSDITDEVNGNININNDVDNFSNPSDNSKNDNSLNMDDSKANHEDNISIFKCPSNHNLESSQYISETFNCDVCKTIYQENSEILMKPCNICDWIICDKCIKKRMPPKNKTDTSDDSMNEIKFLKRKISAEYCDDVIIKEFKKKFSNTRRRTPWLKSRIEGLRRDMLRNKNLKRNRVNNNNDKRPNKKRRMY